MSSIKCLRIATRKSLLAKIQAEWVASKLHALYPALKIDFVELTTSGDQHLSSSLIELGGKGLFVKELEEALLGGKADIAVHSMKDMTVDIPIGLAVPVICEREDARDVLVSRDQTNLSSLAQGARVGTSSLRRSCQLLALRKDLKIIPLRGNVDTRLRKLDQGEFDAIVLAAAGLKRLNLSERVSCYLSFSECLPAVGQGALGLECRAEDHVTQALISSLNEDASFYAVEAERGFNAYLGGGCRAPIAAYAEVKGERLCLQGLIGMPKGSVILRGEKQGSVKEARRIGEKLAQELFDRGGKEILSS